MLFLGFCSRCHFLRLDLSFGMNTSCLKFLYLQGTVFEMSQKRLPKKASVYFSPVS